MFLCFNFTRETLTTPSSGNIRAADWKLETERKYTKSWLIFTLFTKNDLQGQVDIYINEIKCSVISASGSFQHFFIKLSQGVFLAIVTSGLQI